MTGSVENLSPELEEQASVATGEIRQCLFDKTGREIMVGDIVKVFHFEGARRKRHYMYKQAMGVETLGRTANLYMFFSHLAMKAKGERDDGYYQLIDGRSLDDYEIVQSLDAAFEDRPRIGRSLSNQERQ